VGRVAVLSLKLPQALQQPLEDAFRAKGFELTRPQTPQQWSQALARAEIAWLASNADARFLDRPHLRWIHCGLAGLDRFLPPALFVHGVAMTSAAGRSAQALAEHALYLMMALAYDEPGLRRYRRWRRFQAPPPERRRALYGRTLGIVGLGHSGSTLAAYAQALGMRVLGYRRRDQSVAGVDRLYCAANGDRLIEMLRECEFVALACALNQGSLRLLGAPELAALPRGAFLVNIARGALVDEAALLAALRSGQLAGAGLDVFEQEPLPPAHAFWCLPQVLISPHRPPRQHDREQRHATLLAENLRRYCAGEPLLNLLTAADAIAPMALRVPPLSERLRNLYWRLAARAFVRRR
jgi:phosphoglycerate dehydrogenase-like enzyme